jgi:hypothetical protein
MSSAIGPATLSSSTEPSSDVDLVKLIGALAAPGSLDELEDAFTGVGMVLSVPMYGFYVLEPGSDRIEHNVGVNVSDAFVARYDAASASLIAPACASQQRERSPRVFEIDFGFREPGCAFSAMRLGGDRIGAEPTGRSEKCRS